MWHLCHTNHLLNIYVMKKLNQSLEMALFSLVPAFIITLVLLSIL